MVPGIDTYGHIGDEVMHIMGGFPPTNGQTTAKIGNSHSNESISDKVSCNAPVAGIVSDEHDLLLERLLAGKTFYQWMDLLTYPKHA